MRFWVIDNICNYQVRRLPLSWLTKSRPKYSITRRRNVMINILIPWMIIGILFPAILTKTSFILKKEDKDEDSRIIWESYLNK